MELTTTDWRALAPGRELDAIVAERCMGWRRARSPYTTKERKPRPMSILVPPGDRELAHWQVLTGQEVPDTTYHNVPRYSTDVAIAWDVLGTLHGNAERWDAFEAALPEVLAYMEPAATGLHQVEGSRAAYIIVRAALAALDSETRGEG